MTPGWHAAVGRAITPPILPTPAPRLTNLPYRPSPRAVIPDWHAAVDRAVALLERPAGLLGVTDFYVSAK